MPRVNPRKPSQPGTEPSAPEAVGTTLAASMQDFSQDEPYWKTLAMAVLNKFEPTEPDPEPNLEECPHCRGAKWLSRKVEDPNSPAFGTIFPCPHCADFEQSQRDLARRMRGVGLTDKQAQYSFESYLNYHPFPDRSACAFAWEYAEHGTRSMLLAGPTGTGKTGLGIAVFRARIAAGKASTYLYLRTVDLFTRLYDTMGKDSEFSQKQVTDAVADCGLLLLDDLGKEKASEYVASKFYEIIGSRNDWERPTIFTTNLLLEELERRLGDATYWRIMEMCEGNVYLMDGKNLRDPRTRQAS